MKFILLNCFRYLRLTKTNIQELEDHCKKKGIDKPKEFVWGRLMLQHMQYQKHLKAINPMTIFENPPAPPEVQNTRKYSAK